MRLCFYHADLGQKAVFHNTSLHSFNDDGSTRGLLPHYGITPVDTRR